MGNWILAKRDAWFLINLENIDRVVYNPCDLRGVPYGVRYEIGSVWYEEVEFFPENTTVEQMFQELVRRNQELECNRQLVAKPPVLDKASAMAAYLKGFALIPLGTGEEP
jgi:hypothetical protein